MVSDAHIVKPSELTVLQSYVRIIGLILVVFLLMLLLLGRAHTSSAQSRASTIVEQCANTTNHEACYEDVVPRLYPKLSVPQIFDVVRGILREDPSYQFCHVLGHKIGQRVVAEDPSKWLDAIPLNPPDGLCSNGFIHGVIGGRFRADVLDNATIDNLIPDFARACVPRPNWQPSDLDRAICYHGMGHVFDFITNADIPKALDLCSKVAPSEFSRVCVEGVFMQIYQPLEPDDYQLIAQMPIKPSTTTIPSFCARFGQPDFEAACMRESWPFFRTEILDGTGVVKFCANQPNPEQIDNCYTSATTIIGRLHLGEPAQAAAACEQLPTERQVDCFGVIAQAVLEENRTNTKDAMALCERAPADVATQCAAILLRHAPFLFGSNSSEYNAFCMSLPMTLQTRCYENRP